MPIRVTCPECDTKFKADDDRAGKRAACPECGERVPVPDAEADDPAPAKPATARPVVAARPTAKPVPAKPKDEDDGEVLDAVLEDDDAPKSKRRRDDDEDEEKPRANKRRGEDEDDAPKSRRRRDDDEDEAPKKKGGGGLMVLGIVLGVLLVVCGGGGAAVYFFIIKPIGDAAKKLNDGLQSAINDAKGESSAGKMNAQNVAKVRRGWTLAECQEVLGKGKTASESDLTPTFAHMNGAAVIRPVWDAKAKAGLVHQWEHAGNSMAVAFDTDPAAGGKVVGFVADVASQGSNPIALPWPVSKPPELLTADELADRAEQFQDQFLTVSGVAKSVSDTPSGGGNNLLAGVVILVTSPGRKEVRLLFPHSNWTAVKIKPGDTVEVKGKMTMAVGGVTVSDSTLVKHRPATTPTPDPSAALTADQLADKVADHLTKTVTVSGTVRAAVNEADGSGFVEFETAPGKKAVRAVIDAADWKPGMIKSGDKLTAKGVVCVDADGVLLSKAGGGTTPAPPTKPLATLTADGMADEIVVYNAQLIQVSGTAAATGDTPGGGGWVDFVMSGKRKTVRVAFDAANWTGGKIKAGDKVEAKGKAGYGKGNLIELTKCELVKHEAGTPPKPDAEVLTVAQVIDGYDTLKGKVVTMQGKVEFREENINRARGVVAFELVSGAKMSVRAVLEKGNWRTNFLADGDTLTVKGKVTDKPLGPDGAGGKMIVLEDCELLKRTTKDGKDVPIPAKVDPKPDPKPGDAIEVSADDLLAEYIKDPDAAAAKYKDKQVRITGEVKSTTPLTVVFAEKTDKEVAFKVSVFVTPDGRPAISGLKAGDKATLTGKVSTLSAVSPTTKTRTLRISDGKVEK